MAVFNIVNSNKNWIRTAVGLFLSCLILVACAPERPKRPVNISLVNPGKARKFIKACALTLSESDGKMIRPTEPSSSCIKAQGEDPKVKGIQPLYTLKRRNDLVQVVVPIHLVGDESITDDEMSGAKTFLSNPANTCFDRIKKIFERRALYLNFEFSDSEDAHDLYLTDLRPKFKDDEEKREDLRVEILNSLTPSEMSFNGEQSCRKQCRENDITCVAKCGLATMEPFCRSLLREVGFWLGLEDKTQFNACLPEKERRASASESSIFLGYRPELDPDKESPEPEADAADKEQPKDDKATPDADTTPAKGPGDKAPGRPKLDFWARVKLSSEQVMQILQPVCNERNVEVQR